VPDQSQSYSKTTPPRQQEEGVVNNPASMAGNNPAEATPESQASNVNRASEGQQAQAGQAIEGDPHIGTGNLAGDLEPTPQGSTAEGAGDGPSDNYENEDAWPYRQLQQEAKSRHLPGDGKREELVARLRQSDQGNADLTAGVSDTQNPPPAEDSPRAEVSSSDVDNGGIQRTEFAKNHAEILQGLSAERRQQQLTAVRERTRRTDAEAEPEAEASEESVNA
jgi:hypothetical protein